MTYHYTEDKPGSFIFITDNDIRYNVIFERKGEIQISSLSILLYEISFYNGGATGSYDENVSDTILEILADTLSDKTLLYYIAGADYKTSAESRSRLFERWDRNSNFEDYSFINIDLVVPEYDFVMYRGMILHNSLIPQSETIIESINDITLT